LQAIKETQTKIFKIAAVIAEQIDAARRLIMKALFTGLIAGILVSASGLEAASNAQGQAAAYLKFGVDARILGMGGVGSATSKDVNSTYWNPAGLSHLKHREIGAMHTSLSLDRDYNYIGYAAPLKNSKWTLGFGYHRFSISGIPETKMWGFDADGNGKIDDPVLVGDVQTGPAAVVNANDPGRLNAPVKIFSYFEDSENYLSLSAGRKLNKKLHFGATLKYLTQELYTEDADGMGIDLGLQYQYSDRVMFGFTATDLFESLKWSTGRKDDIPTTLTLGGSVKLKSGILVGADVKKKESEDMAFRFGAEKWFMNDYALRVGNNEGEFTVGASAKMNEWTFDYAYNDNDLGSVQRISAKRKF
jgi:hypothetical protein